MRIAIITGSAGGGHNAAARNLAESVPPGTEIKIFHLEECLPPINRRVFISSYDFLSTFGKGFLWRFVYWAGNSTVGMWAYTMALAEFSASSCRRVSQVMAEFKPDAIISTIFLSPSFLNKEFSQIPQYMVITDFGFHRVWYHPNISHYFVGNQLIDTDLKKINPMAHISFTGIPVPLALYQTNTSTVHPPEHSKPHILLLAGGKGLMRADHYVKELLPYADQWSITVVCGNNEKLVKKVRAKVGTKINSIEIIGWTDALSEHIKNSDIIISKPGGLTSSECMAAGKPMILVSPIPGQEEANAAFLIKENRAVQVKKPEDLPGAIAILLQSLGKKNQTVFPVRPAAQSIWEIIIPS